MGAPALLQDLRRRGVTVAVKPGGEKLLVSPPGVLTDADRDQIRAHRAELIDLLQQPPEVLALVGMTTADAGRLSDYFGLAQRHGFGADDAEQIAAQLRLRDRTGLDMAMCIECRRLEGRRCGAARVGLMNSASHQFEPIRAELVRCTHFTANTRTAP
jgi:TubC N-terminal docking domain